MKKNDARKLQFILMTVLLIGFVVACSGAASARERPSAEGSVPNRFEPTDVVELTQTHATAPSGNVEEATLPAAAAPAVGLTAAPLAADSPTADPFSSASSAAGPTQVFLPTITSTVTMQPPTPEAQDPVLVAVGDIADCTSTGDEATAQLVSDPSWRVITLGDNVYDSGTAAEFNNCYDPGWGMLKSRTYPSVGNHEYLTTDATGYFGYFGQAAGSPTQGYYSFDLGSWHVVVLNSNCSKVGGCDETSAQYAWLAADLAKHPTSCSLAVWHHPMFGSTGAHTDQLSMAPLWTLLYNAGAELVLSGHAHNYERMAPQDAAGKLDRTRGMREFIVGTGGKDHQAFAKVAANSEVRDDTTFGVLKLTLHDKAYDWQFLAAPGGAFTDAGTASCH